ncbi:hypothetical protein Pla123a_47970 [Posidoniimonas polymericola]|uniref:DUF2760 domain-containing protein n=1 Tax=Posidoniimonas polymericola TaxID=2528002 RepID=A0A5C5XRM3_9BACT|nr:DUF2760 domain-containing protein [Posidoniimonas polymericola]TWT65886.1 hypothetical protein Pla123a_47970 [Posidoniimonas polymericola]
MRLLLAVRCFFGVLFNGAFAERVQLLSSPAAEEQPPQRAPAAETAPPPAPPAPKRSDAISLLATLQREARFVDIVSEPLDGYSDAQVGAATREVLTDCGKVIRRMFALKPLVDSPEGESLEVPADYSSGRYRLTGNVSKPLPASGALLHAGWEATRCDLPAWTGGEEAALVIAPAEIEIA